MRTVAATLIVPLVVAVAIAFLPILGGHGSMDEWGGVLASITLIYMLALGGTACLVFFLRLLWRRFDFMRAWIAVSIGVVLGCTVAAAFARFVSRVSALQDMPIEKFLRMGIELAIIGAIGGYTFWTIAKTEMRPNTSLERTRDR